MVDILPPAIHFEYEQKQTEPFVGTYFYIVVNSNGELKVQAFNPNATPENLAEDLIAFYASQAVEINEENCRAAITNKNGFDYAILFSNGVVRQTTIDGYPSVTSIQCIYPTTSTNVNLGTTLDGNSLEVESNTFTTTVPDTYVDEVALLERDAKMAGLAALAGLVGIFSVVTLIVVRINRGINKAIIQLEKIGTGESGQSGKTPSQGNGQGSTHYIVDPGDPSVILSGDYTVLK